MQDDNLNINKKVIARDYPEAIQRGHRIQIWIASLRS
jgi:hypothetical protein